MNLRDIIDSRKQDKGVGDTFKRLAEKVGVKPCGGCKKRQDALNKTLPYKKSELR